MSIITAIEKALEKRFAKFKPGPTEPAGFKFTGPTRLYLEYDDSLQYREYDVANGNEVETGVLPMPEKVARERNAA